MKNIIKENKMGKVIIAGTVAILMAAATTITFASADHDNIAKTSPKRTSISTAAVNEVVKAAKNADAAKAEDEVNELGKHPGECGYGYVNENGKHPGESGYGYVADEETEEVNETGKHPGECGYGYVNENGKHLGEAGYNYKA